MDDIDAAPAVTLPTGERELLLFTSACLDDPSIIVVVIPYRVWVNGRHHPQCPSAADRLFGVGDSANIKFIRARHLFHSSFDYLMKTRSKALLRRTYFDESRLTVTAHS